LTFVSDIAAARNCPPQTIEDILSELERSGLLKSAAALRQAP
jgi:DNA-binding IscR family transcriptional regulator